MFEPENSDDLAQKIIKVLHNDGTNDKLIKNGLVFAKSFSIEAQADKYIKLYKKLVVKDTFVPWSDLTKEFKNVIES